MRRITHILLVLVVGAALAAPAAARTRKLVPPGNSASSQYVESVPTAGGGRPSNTIPPGGSGGSGGGGGSLPPSTAHAFAAQGPNGVAAAALARATAPNRPGVPSKAQRTHENGRVGQGVRSAAAGISGSSPLGSVVNALTGSSGGGGLGLLLPIILIGVLLAATVAGLLRRRHTA